MEQRGSREQLVTELDGMAEGWYHLAKDDQSEAASKAARALEAGADEATAGHTTYRVDE